MRTLTIRRSQMQASSSTSPQQPSGASEAQRSLKAEQSYARRQRLQVRNAILMHLKQALLSHEYEPVTLASLAEALNQKFKEKQGKQLAQKISEREFITLINAMISSADVIQIRQCLSVPYSAITQADIDFYARR